MKIFICEICGEAYIGKEKPADCPFCGALAAFIKNGNEAEPLLNKSFNVLENSRKNLMESYDLEVKASSIYNCMAGKAENYQSKAMFKRLAIIEMEHANIVTKILKIEKPQAVEESCPDTDRENFEKTKELEDHAAGLYREFARVADEPQIRILFTALAQAEEGHLALMKELLI